MKLEVIDNHSVAVDLLTKGPVLDAGCRGFRFTEHFAKLGHPVIALDPSPDIEVPNIEGERWSYFYPWALVGPGHPKRAYLRMTEDKEARHLTFAPKESDPAIECKTLDDIQAYLTPQNGGGFPQWDLIKLNVEGAEYDILNGINGPIARQIVVSFHEHTDRARGRAHCDAILERLSPWYKALNVVWERRYGCTENYWNVVLALKELAQ